MLTVFTPTYNRAYILPKLYESLCNQSATIPFEWLIVDDGSTDDTKNLVEQWIKENRILIRYIYQENRGKMAAHNVGVLQSNGEYFICVDSDDRLTTNALSYIMGNVNKVKSRGVGIVAYKGFSDNNYLQHHNFPTNLYTSTLMNLYKQGFEGDTALCFKTEVLRKHLFPKFGEEKFLTEGYVYDQIDQEGELYLLDKVLIECEYQEDGYTNNWLLQYKNNPLGWRAYFVQHLAFIDSIIGKIKWMSWSNAYLFLAKKYDLLVDKKYPLLSFFCIPLGVFLYYNRLKNIQT